MGAAISIFVLISLSVFVVRVASVALRLTGLDEASARFQSLSAFTGTGFTTVEAESVVNYPIRRRIVSLLMIIGNLGLVSVLATLVSSLVATEGEFQAVLNQVVWLLLGLILLWFFMLNPTADKLLCSLLDRILRSTTLLGRRRFKRLLQLTSGKSVCEHPVTVVLQRRNGSLAEKQMAEIGLVPLGIRDAQGKVRSVTLDERLLATERVILYGDDQGHETLEKGTGVPRAPD